MFPITGSFYKRPEDGNKPEIYRYFPFFYMVTSLLQFGNHVPPSDIYSFHPPSLPNTTTTTNFCYTSLFVPFFKIMGQNGEKKELIDLIFIIHLTTLM